MKREAELKSAFMQTLRSELPQFLVLLSTTAGAPDRAIVGNGFTSYWEMKHATPQFDSPGVQELLCMRLAVQAYCRYVLWWESSTSAGQRTMIVHPRVVHERTGWILQPESSCTGFNHRWLVEQIKRLHRVT